MANVEGRVPQTICPSCGAGNYFGSYAGRILGGVRLRTCPGCGHEYPMRLRDKALNVRASDRRSLADLARALRGGKDDSDTVIGIFSWVVGMHWQERMAVKGIRRWRIELLTKEYYHRDQDSGGIMVVDAGRLARLLPWGLLCGQATNLLAALCEHAGFAAEVLNLHHPKYGGHVVVQVYYDGGPHLFDPSHGVYWMRDGKVLSFPEVSKDPAMAIAGYEDAGYSSEFARSSAEILCDGDLTVTQYQDQRREHIGLVSKAYRLWAILFMVVRMPASIMARVLNRASSNS